MIKKLNPIVTELFIRSKKLGFSFAFITTFYFALPKNIRLNPTHCFIIKISKQKELQQITFNHSSNIDFIGFMKLYRKFVERPYFFSY